MLLSLKKRRFNHSSQGGRRGRSDPAALTPCRPEPPAPHIFMNIILIGTGRMGRLLKECALEAGDAVTGEYGRDNIGELAAAPAADVVIDFSGPEALPAVAAYVERTARGSSRARRLHGRGKGGRRSARPACARRLERQLFARRRRARPRPSSRDGRASADFDIEVTETHHNKKKDAPSGTAKLLVEALDPEHALTPVYGREGLCGERRPDEIGIHALRGGTVAGTHSVHFFGPDEELEFTHRASSRRIFVLGALKAARALVREPKGLHSLDDLLFNINAR